MKNILLIITLFISWNAIAEEKVWYCNPQASAGLTFKDSSYEITRFKIDRITIKQDEDKLIFPETELLNEGKCNSWDKVVITCANRTRGFTLNTRTGKATSSSTFGWIHHPILASDDMWVAAWKCESF
jgi:hypothetical protein